MAVGIDFGTTRSKAAYLDATGKPVIVLNTRGEPFTPSVIHYPASGAPLVGQDALELMHIEPERCILYPKLKLGTVEQLLRAGGRVTATDATEQIIAALKADIERQRATALSQCVLTCPANFRDDAKQALKEACERNRIDVLKLVPEPTAAGIAYATSHAGAKHIGVYDFGGGTFDFSLLDVQGGQLTVLSTQGVARLGGNDLNDCLRQRVLSEVASKLGAQPTPTTHAMFFADLEQRVEQAKLSLGRQERVRIVVALDGQQFVVTVSQKDFQADIAPLVQQALDAMDKAVRAAGLAYSQIDRLILVGGTSRIPYIQERVAQHTGLVPKTDVDPDKVVAYGAALCCAIELNRQGATTAIGGIALPAPEVFVRDVTAHAVGCCVVERTGTQPHLLNSVIIPKNTPIPCQRTDRFFLEHEGQTEAQVEILQGEPNADRDACLLIGELRLTDLPPEPKRTQRVQVEYTIDGNGMVTATATDLVSGRSKTVSVDYKKGITPKEKPRAA
jgi:molecular chaperone DnaK